MSTSSFEEVLAKDGKLIYTNVGVSMMPLVHPGRDLLVIEPPEGRLHRLDVALYRRDSGQYVLHRILRVRKNDYVICGDNQWCPEYGIEDRHIIGVLRAIIRDGEEIRMDEPRVRTYAHLWCDFFPIRSLIIRARQIIRNRWRKHHG